MKSFACVVCNRPTPKMADRCTNQCCMRCHAEYCTHGGATAPGHGINIPAARTAIAKALPTRAQQRVNRQPTEAVMSKRNYTKGSAQCMVAVIECVYQLGEVRDMEEVMEQLQQYGAAKVIETFAVKEDFEEASKILETRTIKPR